MRQLLVIILGLLPVVLYSQFVTGKIIDADSKIPLEYVNIGVIGKDKGTVCDKAGVFSLELPERFDNDTLRISIVGYDPVLYSVWEFKKLYQKSIDGLIIELTKKISLLTDVIVGRLEFREKEIGNKGKLGNLGFVSAEITLGFEVGTIIKIHKINTFIQKVNIVFKHSNYDDSVTFRINIYSMNNGFPNENILQEPINITTKIKDETLTINLEKYNIYIDDDVLISLEWLTEPGGKTIEFGSGFKSESFMRHTCESEWKKIPLGVGIGIFATVIYTK